MGLKKRLTYLIPKYSQSGPRYTSYPTAPQWTETLAAEAYAERLKGISSRVGQPLSLYVHVPFCESLCYYCGCNIQINKNRERSLPYVGTLKKELAAVSAIVGSQRPLAQISWGGGTPTFLSLSEISAIDEATKSHFSIEPDAEVSIEIDPRVTTNPQLELLSALGFNRVSLGLQDFNPEVQSAVNRIQSAELTQHVVRKCRELGFKGVNLDLIYGLPLQTIESFQRTIEQVIEIRPDRIALYNYAHIPNMIAHQKILLKYRMPTPEERVEIFSLAYDRLVDAGYEAIGMDHFALADDEMFKALNQGSLYRNFMGYTVKKGTDMIGIGASAIGDLGDAYFQNLREAKAYESTLAEGNLATFRGVLLSEDDRKRKWIIQRLMCQFKVPFADYQAAFGRDFVDEFHAELATLGPLYEDELLIKDDHSLKVTELGRLFIRNIAMAFDAYLKAPSKVTYSKTV